jgi:hypothetical protein
MAGQVEGYFCVRLLLMDGWEDAYTGSEDMIVDVLCGVMWLLSDASRSEAESVVFGGRAVVFVG